MKRPAVMVAFGVPVKASSNVSNRVQISSRRVLNHAAAESFCAVKSGRGDSWFCVAGCVRGMGVSSKLDVLVYVIYGFTATLAVLPLYY